MREASERCSPWSGGQGLNWKLLTLLSSLMTPLQPTTVLSQALQDIQFTSSNTMELKWKPTIRRNTAAGMIAFLGNSYMVVSMPDRPWLEVWQVQDGFHGRDGTFDISGNRSRRIRSAHCCRPALGKGPFAPASGNGRAVKTNP